MKRPDRLPEPALVRSVGVTITAVAAYLLGREVSTEWVETVTTIYALLSASLAGLLIRPAVTSMARLEALGIELPRGRHALPESRE